MFLLCAEVWRFSLVRLRPGFHGDFTGCVISSCCGVIHHFLFQQLVELPLGLHCRSEWRCVCVLRVCVCVCVRRTLYLNVWAVMSWHQKQVCNMYTDYANARTLSPVRSCSLSNIKLHHGKFPFTSTIFLFSERVTPSSHSHLSSTWKIVVSCCKMDSSWGWDCFVDHLFFYLPFRSGVTTF